MSKPPIIIALPVRKVSNGVYTRKGWKCEVTFGIPHSWAPHTDPTITCTSEDVEKFPKPGDIMLVYPPQIVGYQEVPA